MLHVYAFKTQQCVTPGRSTEAELTYVFGDRELIFLRSAYESREIYCKSLDHQHCLQLFKGGKGQTDPIITPIQDLSLSCPYP